MNRTVMHPIVYILDSDRVMAESISWIIETIQIQVKSYSTAEDFLKCFDKNQHACLLLDTYLFDMPGLQVQEILKKMGAILPVIFLSGCDSIPFAVQAIKNGAFDFLTKPFNDFLLLECINKALNLDYDNRENILDSAEAKFKLEQLSPRELQVLRGIIEGKQNKSISIELNISLKTIEAHRASLMKKMEVKSVSALVRLALLQDIHFSEHA